MSTDLKGPGGSGFSPIDQDELVQVAVDSAAPGFYTYLAPAELNITVGQMVRVPFGHRELVGYVMGAPGCNLPAVRLKRIIEVIRSEPLFGTDLTRLVEFVANYYMYPAGLCVREILPGGLAPKLVRTVGLTEIGLDASDLLLGQEFEIRKKLLDAHPNRLPASEFNDCQKIVKKMVVDGQLFVSYDFAGRGLRHECEWWLSPNPEPLDSPKRLGPMEQQLWNLLKGSPPTPLSHFAHYLKNPLVQARSLMTKGLVILEKRERERDDPNRALNFVSPDIDELTEDQKKALAQINGALDRGEQRGFLLFGVTGSGKTEVYLQATIKTLAAGRGVLWLAPEIALTMGLEGRLRQRLPGQRISVLHSGLTPGQRHDHWLNLQRGVSLMALGARSAVFAPLNNPGLVVVDEEHDWAYKQDDGLRYNGRDLALWRAKKSGAVIILGSATPSLESYQSALKGRLTMLKMKTRPGLAVLPEVILVDQRQEPGRGRRVLSGRLKKEMSETLARGEQALFFLNRRGLANLPMCLSCGEPIKCPHCSLTLTLHGPESRTEPEEVVGKMEPGSLLVCHGCGYQAYPPEKCPKCQSEVVRYLGIGTERLLKILEKEFGVRGFKLDADSTRNRGEMKKILEGFGEKKAEFLVGTQMAAKGHDFSNLTLVGVIDADLGLNMADFRAAERSFQLLSQVAGRAGRGERPGIVIVQTVNPGHYALVTAKNHDYETFFKNEIAIRAELGYPPFARLALVRLSGPEDEVVSNLADQAAEQVRQIISSMVVEELELFGPAPSPVSRLRERFRYQMMLRSPTVEDRHRVLRAWLPGLRKKLPRNIILTVDVDPYHQF